MSTLFVFLTQLLIQIKLQLQPLIQTQLQPQPLIQSQLQHQSQRLLQLLHQHQRRSALPATGAADVVVPASVLAVSGLGFVAASRKVRK